MKILILFLLTILQLNTKISRKAIRKEFAPFLKLDTLTKIQKFPKIEQLLKRANTPQSKIDKARKAFLRNTPRALQSYLRPLSSKEFFGFLALDLVGYTFINNHLKNNQIRKLQTQLRGLHKQVVNTEMKEYEMTKQLNSAIADLQSRLEEFEARTDANVSNLTSYASMQNDSLI